MWSRLQAVESTAGGPCWRCMAACRDSGESADMALPAAPTSTHATAMKEPSTRQHTCLPPTPTVHCCTSSASVTYLLYMCMEPPRPLVTPVPLPISSAMTCGGGGGQGRRVTSAGSSLC